MPWPARIQNGWIQPDALDALSFTTDQKVGGSSPSERATTYPQVRALIFIMRRGPAVFLGVGRLTISHRR
jgi:hypothetical protein